MFCLAKPVFKKGKQMTTFTTQDRQDAEKYRDITIKGFNFRFVKEGDEWVCRMPDWLLKNAEDLLK